MSWPMDSRYHWIIYLLSDTRGIVPEVSGRARCGDVKCSEGLRGKACVVRRSFEAKYHEIRSTSLQISMAQVHISFGGENLEKFLLGAFWCYEISLNF